MRAAGSAFHRPADCSRKPSSSAVCGPCEPQARPFIARLIVAKTLHHPPFAASALGQLVLARENPDPAGSAAGRAALDRDNALPAAFVSGPPVLRLVTSRGGGD